MKKPEYIDHDGQVVGIRADGDSDYHIPCWENGDPILFGEHMDARELFERCVIHNVFDVEEGLMPDRMGGYRLFSSPHDPEISNYPEMRLRPGASIPADLLFGSPENDAKREIGRRASYHWRAMGTSRSKREFAGHALRFLNALIRGWRQQQA